MNEDQETVRRSIEDGDFDIEWIRSTPEVLFWPGEPFDTIVKRVSLRELLLRDLRTSVPLAFFGDPMAFDPPKGWVHAEQARLLQALIRAYDKWEKRAAR
jgi:hypothetical protein